MAKKPESQAPPVRWKNSDKQADKQVPGRADQQNEQKEYPKKTKREAFQEKHRRYNADYEYPTRNQEREHSVPKGRYEDFLKKRERYRDGNRLEQYRFESPIDGEKYLIDGQHHGTIESIDNKAMKLPAPSPIRR